MTRTLTMIVLCVGLATVARAQDDVEDLTRDLELSAQQRQQLRDIADDAKKEKVRARAEMEVLEIDLKRELDRDNPDEKKVADLVEKLAAAEGRTRKARILASIKVKRLLTAEQRKQLEGRRPARSKPKRVSEPPDVVDPFRDPSSSSYEEKLQGARAAHASRQRVGYLTLNTQPWSRVVIDGKDTGKTTPIMRLELKPGRHTITFVHGDKKLSHNVVVEPGEEMRIIKRLNFDDVE